MKKASRRSEKNVTFQYISEAGKEVYIAGTFNDWQVDKTKLKDNGVGEYAVAFQLPEGRYEYKFIVDGVWCMDFHNSETVNNDCNSMNNVITVE